MKYCRIAGHDVYSCDHAECNGRSNQSQQGMKYCKISGRYVYGCDHHDCK